jgi:diguanylate cyclase (GGDEF)-like protein
VVLDPQADGLTWLAQSTPLGSMQPKAVMLVPLVAEQHPVALAVIGVASSSVVEAQRAVIDACRLRAGPQLLNAVLHKKLQEMAAMDELTGVLNRRFGTRRLAEEHARSVRHGLPLAVFLLDIDHFKRFNDTHGHDAGDEVLRRVARSLESSVRSSDVVCRYGGEEFLVLAPGAGTQDGFVLADRLRRKIESIDIQWKGQRLTVNGSFGVASWPTVRAAAPEELVTRADEALYAAKTAGRNRVFVHDGTAAKPGEASATDKPTDAPR